MGLAEPDPELVLLGGPVPGPAQIQPGETHGVRVPPLPRADPLHDVLNPDRTGSGDDEKERADATRFEFDRAVTYLEEERGAGGQGRGIERESWSWDLERQ